MVESSQEWALGRLTTRGSVIGGEGRGASGLASMEELAGEQRKLERDKAICERVRGKAG